MDAEITKVYDTSVIDVNVLGLKNGLEVAGTETQNNLYLCGLRINTRFLPQLIVSGYRMHRVKSC